MSDDFNRTWQAVEQPRWAGIGAVSGNANVQIYLRKPGAPLEDWTVRPSCADLRACTASVEGRAAAAPVDLIAMLLGDGAVSHVHAADRDAGAYRVLTRSGEGVICIRRTAGGERTCAYAVANGDDPPGYRDHGLTAPMVGSGACYDGDVWAAAMRDTNFPDGIVQVVQLLEGKNSGDIIVGARPGFEPWDQMQRGLHGALRRERIVVPLLIHGPRLDAQAADRIFSQGRMPRTADVYPTLLTLMGKRPPSRIDWEIPRLGGLLGLELGEAKVRTDIDGQALAIWTE